MSPPASPIVMIPARITVRDLAEVIARDVEEVRAELRSRDEDHGPDETLPAELAVSVSKALGSNVSVEARDLALEALYEYDTRRGVSASLHGRARRIFEGVLSRIDELDAMIEEVSQHWSVARMPVVDRNILRIGLFELQNHPDTPTAVVVSEAVRLAQIYSTERSASFVNGLLATLAKKTQDS